MELQKVKIETLSENNILLVGTPKTCFTFKVEQDNFTQKELNLLLHSEENTETNYSILEILSKRANIILYSIENKTFKNNMILVDSYLHIIMAEILLLHYLNDNNLVAELVTKLAKKNPLIYGTRYNQQFYERKVKEFLYHIVMGMSPCEIWHGEYDTSKQFLIKGNSNEFITYNIYNRSQFEEYLFYNTILDTGSSTKQKFETIYKDPTDNCYYLKLNLQIRLMNK